ncbi:MAG: hypothetical protein KDE58_22160, partial [Caldilineaceae bacterium]|nr:hypothetical protein [Caldilineaceae bacterium]
QIPDSRRDCQIPAERLNPQNFGHGLLEQSLFSIEQILNCDAIAAYSLKLQETCSGNMLLRHVF